MLIVVTDSIFGCRSNPKRVLYIVEDSHISDRGLAQIHDYKVQYTRLMLIYIEC